MAIIDRRNEFCDNTSVALTAGASPQNIGFRIDIGGAAGNTRDIGNGEPLYLVVAVQTGINAAGAGSIQFSLVSDDTATPATNGTATVHLQSPVFVTSTTTGNAGGTLAAGRQLWVVPLPLEGNAYERFVGVQATVLTQNTTAGAVEAFLTHSPQAWKSYDAPFHL